MSYRNITIVSLLVAAAAIVLQIIGGAEYPVIPPGAVILIVVATLIAVVRRWWILAVPAALIVALLVGAVATPNVGDNLAAGGFARAGGTAVQLVAMVVALGSAVLGLARERLETRAETR